MRFLSSVFVAAMLVATQASAKPEVILFSDLADPLAITFDDPYRDMGFRLLNELKLVVELDRNSRTTNLERRRVRVWKLAACRAGKVKANGQDVDVLLSSAGIVAKKRQAARMATNPIFDGAEITLSGYLIPAPRAVDGSGFGYLVSQVGMCSHLPPPPPNQLVRVKLRADQGSQSLYVPVRISGALHVEKSDATIFILDGKARMLSGWTLEAKTIDLSVAGKQKQK